MGLYALNNLTISRQLVLANKFIENTHKHYVSGYKFGNILWGATPKHP